MAEQFTDELVELVAHAISTTNIRSLAESLVSPTIPIDVEEMVRNSTVNDFDRTEARAVLTALAEAGLLLPQDAKIDVCTEWGVFEAGQVDISAMPATDLSEQYSRDYAAIVGAKLFRRTVRTCSGPWVEVPDA